MLIDKLKGIKTNGFFKSSTPDENNDSNIKALSESQKNMSYIKELSHITIFDDVNGIMDSSDSLYPFKKCLSSFNLDIPTHEKIEILEWLSTCIGKLSDDDYNLLSSWCKDAYKPICKYLKSGISVGGNAVEIANIFRWGSSLIKKDIHLSRRLIEKHYPFHDVVSNPSKFHFNVVYAHSNMLSHYYFDISLSHVERSYYARTSISLLNHLLSFETALNNRANYLFSMVYKVLGNVELSLHHFIKALRSEHSLPFQKNLIIRLLFDALPDEKLPHRIEKVLVDSNRILNSVFWSDLSERIFCHEIKNKIKSYAIALSENDCTGSHSYELSNFEINDINSYIDSVHTIDYCCDEIKSRELLSIATAKETPAIAKHVIFKRLAYSFININSYAAMYYASMSLYNKYDVDVVVFIQRMLLDFDYSCVCDAVASCQDGPRDLAIINVTESFNVAVWIDGEPLREIAILEYVINNSRSQAAVDLAKIRAAFLYIKGECTANLSLGIQNFKKGDEYLNSLSVNDAQFIKDGIRDHGFYRHQQSLIQKSVDGESVFIEKKGSDKLIIVFSCRYTYNVFQIGPRFIEGLETNALFINNPSGNWYSDSEEERVSLIINDYALSKFSRENILCHNASMGGYAAIKFAIKHKLICIAANPQFNLNFWSFARPIDAKRILLCDNIVNLDKISSDETDGLKACIIIGRHPHDILPFQSWFDNAIKAKNFTYIIIKHDIPEHDALMYRAYGDTFMREIYKKFEALQKIDVLSSKLKPCDYSEIVEIQKEINGSYTGHWIIHNKNGKYFTA